MFVFIPKWKKKLRKIWPGPLNEQPRRVQGPKTRGQRPGRLLKQTKSGQIGSGFKQPRRRCPNLAYTVTEQNGGKEHGHR